MAQTLAYGREEATAIDFTDMHCPFGRELLEYRIHLSPIYSISVGARQNGGGGGGLPALCTSLSWPTPTFKVCTPLLLLGLTFEKWRAKHPNRFAPAMRRKDPPANGRLSAVPLIHTSWPRTTGSSLADLHAPSNSKAMVRNIRMCGVRVWLVTTRPLCGTVESACVWYMLALCGGSMAI